MLIDHPLLGPRDAREFVYLGDASLIERPDPDAFATREDAIEAFVDWLYVRDNPAGVHEELWYHEQGDRSWLVVTRDTTTHEIHRVRLARDVALERGRGTAHEATAGTRGPTASPGDGEAAPENAASGVRAEGATTSTAAAASADGTGRADDADGGRR